MSASVNGREVALDTLLLVTRDGEYSHTALRSVLDKHQYLEKRERAFITRVVEGTLEHMIEIDYIIDQFSKIKTEKMKPVIRTILRSGVYQIKYMDSVPDRAVCNESVKLAGKRGFGSLKGFVNGVLRNISRGLDDIAYPKDEAAYLSVRYSLPEWIVSQWLREYDAATVRRMGEAFLADRPTCVRCNTAVISKEKLMACLREEGVTVTEDENMPCALYIEDYDYLAKLQSFREGYFYVQDLSSMEAAQWAAPEEGCLAVDVCAAPGGKALHLAEIMKGSGQVIARDLTEYKTGLIRENVERSGLDNIKVQQWDARIFDEELACAADVVIADLPCSGLGVLGKKTDLKYKMTPKQQEELAGLQREILSVACGYVKPGGRLLYSTCTIHKKENEENAQWFLKTHPDFELRKEQQRLPRTDRGDGFYLALFVRAGNGCTQVR